MHLESGFQTKIDDDVVSYRHEVILKLSEHHRSFLVKFTPNFMSISILILELMTNFIYERLDQESGNLNLKT